MTPDFVAKLKQERDATLLQQKFVYCIPESCGLRGGTLILTVIVVVDLKRLT